MSTYRRFISWRYHLFQLKGSLNPSPWAPDVLQVERIREGENWSDDIFQCIVGGGRGRETQGWGGLGISQNLVLSIPGDPGEDSPIFLTWLPTLSVIGGVQEWVLFNNLWACLATGSPSSRFVRNDTTVAWTSRKFFIFLVLVVNHPEVIFSESLQFFTMVPWTSLESEKSLSLSINPLPLDCLEQRSTFAWFSSKVAYTKTSLYKIILKLYFAQNHCDTCSQDNVPIHKLKCLVMSRNVRSPGR